MIKKKTIEEILNRKTDKMSERSRKSSSKIKKQPIKFLRSFKKNVPLSRLGKPHEIATTAVFLSSDAASYINGATIMVDGGWTAI